MRHHGKDAKVGVAKHLFHEWQIVGPTFGSLGIDINCRATPNRINHIKPHITNGECLANE